MRARFGALLFSGLLLAGCTKVAFRAPVGKPAAAEDQDYVIGSWTGEKGIVWTVDRDSKSGLLRASWVEDGKPQTRLFAMTEIGKSEALVWEKEEDLDAYVPLRISGAEDALALLYPDDKLVEKLVADGKVTAALDKKKNAWIFGDGDWAALLERRDFWKIEMCMPFVRNFPPKAPGAPKPAPAPKSGP